MTLLKVHQKCFLRYALGIYDCVYTCLYLCRCTCVHVTNQVPGLITFLIETGSFTNPRDL